MVDIGQVALYQSMQSINILKAVYLAQGFVVLPLSFIRVRGGWGVRLL